MADIIGRTNCPECGDTKAHIKRSEGKLPYRHCPECGFITQSRNRYQETLLLAKMRPVDEPAPKPATTAAPPTHSKPVEVAPGPAPKVAPAPARPARRAGIFDTLLGASAHDAT